MTGGHYVKAAIQKKDKFYSCITGCLLSLGWLQVASGIVGILGMALLISGKMNQPDRIIIFVIQQSRFLIFIILSFFAVAFGAVGSHPNLVTPGHDLFHYRRIGRDGAEFEISAKQLLIKL